MNILVTGSSGWLAQTLIPLLIRDGHKVTGIDPKTSPLTAITGGIADRALVGRAIRDNGITAIIHGGALHKPNIATNTNQDFIDTNVTGTLNLLEEAVANGVDRFVFTSITSLMISQEIRDGRGPRAVWIDETLAPLQPRNIYGVTKYAAEKLCHFFHKEHGLPLIILRTARFFPEEDDMAHDIDQSEPNTKANEFLFRRLTVEDAAAAHIAALARAPEIGFDTFLVSAKTPFIPADCAQLMTDAPGVVRRYFPDYEAIYAARGWTMFTSIDRVYDAGRLERRLGFVCRTGFAEILQSLRT
jgi:UDP-glucose 4-epimerase